MKEKQSAKAIDKQWQEQARRNRKRNKPRPLVIRDFTQSEWVTVKIMGRPARIEVKPGQDPEQIKAKYQKQAA